jgi:hypothetical protein
MGNILPATRRVQGTRRWRSKGFSYFKDLNRNSTHTGSYAGGLLNHH